MVLLIIFVFFCSLLHVIVPKFPNIFVHDSYTVRRAIMKNVIVTGQPCSGYHVRVGLRRPIRLEEML